MNHTSLFRKTRAAPERQRSPRPVLEPLEDRCLPSGGYTQVNLASDMPGLARVTDSNLVNPWGIAFSPTGPFWFSDNGRGVSDLLDGRGQPLPLVVAVPSATGPGGTSTGMVFNGRAGFVISENDVSAPSRFLFASEDGTISGWTTVVDPTHALLAVDNSSSGAVYKGLALATDPADHSFLYAADFSRGTIDVFDQAFRPVMRPGSFQDPNLPDGFVPFNIQNINNLLFVTYALQDAAIHDDIAGAGNGFIDVYDINGNLLRRFASRGALDSPWGLTLAPASFGPFGGALLVGDNGDGRINAYDLASGTYLGELADDKGIPIAISGLWALTFGNGHAGGDADTLFFAAGVNAEGHGLFGALQPPQRFGADTAGVGAFDPNDSDEPGDYPLPPSGGPALRASTEEHPVPVSDLLPLRDSSLALAPTLVTFSQPNMRIEAPASSAILLIPTVGNSQLARGVYHNVLALHTFLDLNPSLNPPRKGPGVQQQGSNPDAIGASSSDWANSDAGAGELLAGYYVETFEAQSRQEQGPEALPSSGLASEALETFPLESCLQSADECAAANECAGTRYGGRWTNLTNLLIAVSIPVLWASRLWNAIKLRHES
jgi:uncharacterized protein (TIGR03118 family)